MITKNSGIYIISSLTSPDKIYIGSAVSIYRRKNEHVRTLKNGKHHNTKLQNHVNKYGINDLTFNVIEECEKHNLIEREQYYIDKKEPFFNIARNAGSTLGVYQSEKTRKLRSESRKGYIITEETKQKMREYRLLQVPKQVKGFIIKEIIRNEIAQRGGYTVKAECPMCHSINTYSLSLLKKRKTYNCGCYKEPKPKKTKVLKGRATGYPVGAKIKRKDNTTGYIGITYDKAIRRYRAQIKHNQILIRTKGSHETVERAVIARNQYIIDNNLPHLIQQVI